MKLKTLAMFAVILTVCTSGQASAQETKLVVGTDCDYVPYSFKDPSGQLKGFEIDLANEIGQRLGRTVEFICTPFDASIPSLTAQKFDVLFNTLSITEERKKQVDFTIPYRANTGRFGGARAKAPKIYGVDGKMDFEFLKGRVVGVQAATVYQDYLVVKFPAVTVRLYDKLPSLYEDLMTGRIDLALASTSSIWAGLVAKDPATFIFVGPDVEDPIFGEGVGGAVRKGDPLLVDLNEALEAIFDDGTFQRFNEKYFPFTLMPSVWK
jgi:ABC-type amino acid transport substrate-binding protein